MTGPDVRIDVLLGAEEGEAALLEEARTGLTATPKRLSPKWLYDEAGSQLFSAITELPEYYLTRREREILRERAAEIVELADADTLVELGSGTSEKTRILLGAMREHGTLRRYAPFDVSEEVLRESATAVGEEYPGIAVHGIVGDFGHHLGAIPSGGRRLVAFLGSTIGNLPPDERLRFLADVSETLTNEDSFLLGIDLVKDLGRLHAAYNDAAGVTRRFSRNVLAVLNRELDADFDLELFDHDAVWDPEHEWMDIGVRSRVDQTVPARRLGLDVHFEAGEKMRTEVSSKFRRGGVEAELAAAGLAVVCWWTDPAADFALCLSRKSGDLERAPG